LKDPPTIIHDNQTLYSRYQQLQINDIVCGRIRIKQGEEHVLIDLLERGIRLIPSATSQLASRSKTFQARIFSEFMLPGTLAIYDTHALLSASSLYRQQQHTKVILKCDRKNGGLGIHVFNDIEELYNHASIGSISYPFVIQPYLSKIRDIRVIILGDYLEAYERINPYNFRKNLHCGGDSTPYTMTDQQVRFCEKVMQRGHFPYAHLDLLLTPNGDCHLAEINLRGGLKGAKISGKEYQEKIGAIHEKLLALLASINRK
jgi:ribosomal protein S6--L-glutamate ligase